MTGSLLRPPDATALEAPAIAPLVFGAGCVGWLHPPAPTHARTRGVVLCPPFGYEGLSTYRAMRELAALLAASGLPVLRFDYPNAGEAAGEAETPPSVAACVAAAADAAALLRRAGCGQVAFAGCRFGALVATLAAAAHPGGAAALALLAPVLSGRSYARELRLLAYGLPGTEPTESAGFPITPEFLAELGALDLRRLNTAPADRSLLLTVPDRIAPATALAATWSAGGQRASAAPFAGAERLLAEAHGVEAPRAAFEAMRRVLAEAAPPAHRIPSLPIPSATLRLPDGVTEQVVRFGPGERLVGTWCLPDGGAAPGITPLLIPGTGANMRAGNGRLSVLLARRAARRGIASLRYDMTGVGDSGNPDGTPLTRLMYSRRAIEDAGHAMDWLAASGHPRAMAVGNCAGAYTALHLAIADSRIVFTVPANLQRFLWREGRLLTVPATRSVRADAERLQWEALRDALAQRARPVDLLRALLPPHVKHAWKRSVVRGQAALAWAAPRGWVRGMEAGRVRLGLEALSRRGGRVLFVYCADDAGLDEFEAHLGRGGRRLALLPGFARALVDGADHTLSTAEMRGRFLDIVVPALVEASR